MNQIKNLLIALVSIISLTLTSCNDDNNGGGGGGNNTFLVYATLVSYNSDGCTFTANESDDKPTVTYTSNVDLTKESVKPAAGKRYIIMFSNETNNCWLSGPITLYALYTVNNGDVQVAAKSEIDKYDDPCHVYSISRTAQYINIEAKAPVQTTPRTYNIYVDEATVNDEIPQAYIVYQSDNLSSQFSAIYASFDISNVWNRPTCKGLTIHYTDAAGRAAQETFPKGSQTIRPQD